jgi:hypothetical protein
VHEFALGQAFVLHIDGVTAHLLQAAHVAGSDGLPGQELRILAFPRFYAGHVVQGLAAYGFGHGHSHGHAFFGLPGPDVIIGGLALAAAADGPVAGRVSLAADRAGLDASHVAVTEQALLHRDVFQAQDGVSGGLDLAEQLLGVLLLLGYEL